MTGFPEFYAAYPHKKGRSVKRLSRKLYDKLTGDGLPDAEKDIMLETPARLLAAAKAYYDDIWSAYCRAESGHWDDFVAYVPACQAWLFQGRFEDWLEEEEETKLRVVP